MVTLARRSVAGGDGDGPFPGQTAIAELGGRPTIAGDARDVYRAGATAATAQGSPAIHDTGAVLVIAAPIRLVPNTGQPAIVGP